MLRFMTFLCALVLAGAAHATTMFVDTPRDGFLNLRAGPSTAYHVVQKMAHGQRVEILRAPGKWVKLKAPSGYIGWAHSGYLSHKRPGKPKPPHYGGHDGHEKGTYYVNAPRYKALNLRTGPGTSYAVAFKMKHRDKVTVLGKQGKWWLLRHESGRVGYAHSGYLSKKRPHKPAPSYHKPAPKYGHGHGPSHAQPKAQSRDLADILQHCAGRQGPHFHRCLKRQLGLLPRQKPHAYR